MGQKDWNAVAELAAVDMEAREGLTYYDKLNKLRAEEQLGPGFQPVDTAADPAETPVEPEENKKVRRVADFWIRNHCSPAAASEMAAERGTANAKGQAALANVCLGIE